MGRRIAIVGNGELGAAVPLAYDSDFVIRFNECGSAGDAATRTDVVAVCNTGRPPKSMLAGAWRTSEAVASAGAIWAVRAAERYARMRPELAKTHPELGDYCDDYTAQLEAFAHGQGKDFRVISAALHEQVEAELEVLGAGDFVSPSSGLLVIADVLENHAQADDEVMIAGFSHEGWEHHPWEAERSWVEARIADGRLGRAEEFYETGKYQESKAHAL